MELWANDIAGNRTSSDAAAATLASAFRNERMIRTSKKPETRQTATPEMETP
jgi:hypothetical protein